MEVTKIAQCCECWNGSLVGTTGRTYESSGLPSGVESEIEGVVFEARHSEMEFWVGDELEF